MSVDRLTVPYNRIDRISHMLPDNMSVDFHYSTLTVNIDFMGTKALYILCVTTEFIQDTSLRDILRTIHKAYLKHPIKWERNDNIQPYRRSR